MSNYTFTYKGQTKETSPTDEVKSKLAKQFNVPPKQLDRLFNGQQIFERTDLSHEVAKSYLQLFQSLGAIGSITEQTVSSKLNQEDNKAETTKPSCPKCNSFDINHERCLKCGVYFHKLSNSSAVEDLDDDVYEIDEESNKAARLFSIASTLLVALFIIDNVLSNWALTAMFSIDIGFLPYLGAHLFLIYACSKFAEIKGYSSTYGALGFLSFLGVAILLMLPNRYAPDSKPSLKAKGLTALCVLMATVWLYDFSNRQSDLTLFKAKATEFVENIQHYPEGMPIADNARFLEKEAALESFCRELFATLYTHDYRFSEKKTLAELALSSAAQYRIWLNYQRYLVLNAQHPLPPYLETKQLRSLDERITKWIEEGIPETADPRLVKVKHNWTIGLDPDQSKLGLWSYKFNSALFSLHRDIKYSVLNNYHKNGRLADHIDASSLKLQNDKGLTVISEISQVKVTIDKGPLKGRFMVIGVYSAPTRVDPYTKKKYNELIIEPIYINFPGKYLQGDMGPLKPYIPWLE